MNRLVLTLALTCCYFQVSAQNKFTIEDVILRAQTQSPAFKQAETRKENRYWAYRYFRTNYNPQIRVNSNNAGVTVQQQLYTHQSG